MSGANPVLCVIALHSLQTRYTVAFDEHEPLFPCEEMVMWLLLCWQVGAALDADAVAHTESDADGAAAAASNGVTTDSVDIATAALAAASVIATKVSSHVIACRCLLT